MMRRSPGRRSVWLFRCGALLLGLLPFVVIEGSLRVLDLPTRVTADPFVDLHNLRPLFQQQTPGVMEIAEERWNLFRPASFELPKPSNTVRIFALGGSTTQGEPYSTETSFAKWLEIDLQAAAPRQRIEVVNCGGLSYASYRVARILEEILQYEADLVVVYTGHNEYLERRSYQGLRGDALSAKWRSSINELRIVQLTRQLMVGATGDRFVVKNPTELQTEVDALLDYREGLADYDRNAAWLVGVPQHFEWNIRQMMLACRAAGVPVVFMTPVSNLVDCPPFKIEISPELAGDDAARFEALWSSARSAEDPLEALEFAHSALELDPQHAGANYLVGKLYYERNETAAAEPYLTAARDQDVCPLRATSELVKIVREVAHAEGVPLLDAVHHFSEQSPGGLVGDNWLIDHVHPTVEGHRELARALSQLCLERELVAGEESDWRAEADRAALRHLEELGEAYFQRGAQRLEGLRLWTQGRANKLRKE